MPEDKIGFAFSENSVESEMLNKSVSIKDSFPRHVQLVRGAHTGQIQKPNFATFIDLSGFLSEIDI